MSDWPRSRSDGEVRFPGASGVPEIEHLRRWVRWFVDAEPCVYDHHGYCQTHRLDPAPCPMEEIRAYLVELGLGEGQHPLRWRRE